MICTECQKSEMCPREVDDQVNFWGIAGGAVVLLGLVVLLFAPIMGILVVIAGLIISMVGRSKKTLFLICPACKHQVKI